MLDSARMVGWNERMRGGTKAKASWPEREHRSFLKINCASLLASEAARRGRNGGSEGGGQQKKLLFVNGVNGNSSAALHTKKGVRVLPIPCNQES